MKRDGYCCSYTNPKTGKRCNSTYMLELDHKQPYALGGRHTVENIFLRCKQHNLFHAVQCFGKEKMDAYFL